MKKSLLLIVTLIALTVSNAAQLPTCAVSGIAYGLNGQPKGGIKIRVVRVEQSGTLIEIGALETVTAIDGTWTLNIPRSSAASFCSPSGGLVNMTANCGNGTKVPIPNSPTADYSSLIPVINVPPQGIAVKDEGVPLISRVGTINFTGAGVTATETSPGVATINITSGGGSSLTAREADGSPSINNVATLEFNQGNGLTVTDQTGGVARVGLSAVPFSSLASLTANRALATSGSGVIITSSVTDTELGHLSGVSSAIQTQIDGKAATSHSHSAGDITSGTLGAARGGTGQTSATNNGALIGDGSAFVLSVIPSCSNATNDKLLYNNSTRAFTCGSDQAGAGGGITTLNTLTAATQTFSRTNDTNVTLTIGSTTDDHNFALGWTGTLAKARQHANTVYNDQANTFGAFVQTFQAGSNHLLVDPSDTSKRFQFDASNITTSTTRTVNIPNANSTTVQASSAPSNQFANAISAQGVVSYAQPSFSNLSGTASAAQVQEVIGLADLTDVSAKTGTGTTVVMSTSPSLTTPTLGVASATSITVDNTGLLALDTNASHTLNFKPGSNITANRTLTFTTGDADRTITLNGDTTLSGTNTGDQTITLTSDVTGSGTGSFATTIANNAVSDAKFRQSAGLSVVGRSANSTGNIADITAASDGDVLRRSGTSLGFGTIATAGIGDAQVTNAKLANSSITVNGTTNQVNVSGSPVSLGGTVTLSTPQSIHTGATPQFAALGLGETAPAAGLELTGKTISADADGTVGAADMTFSLTKNNGNTRTFPGLLIKPTINTGGSNAATTLNVVDIDTTNTATTGVTTNLINAKFGAAAQFVLGTAGGAFGSSTTTNAQLYALSGSTSRVGFIVDTPSSPTVDIAQFRNNASSTVAFAVKQDGMYTFPGIKRLSSNFSKTSDTTLATVTGLSVPVRSGRSYKFQAVLHLTCGASAGGVNVRINGSATATSAIWNGNLFREDNETLLFVARGTALSTTIGDVSAGTSYFLVIDGTIVVNAGGNLDVQFAQGSSNATASTVLAGSTWEVIEIQ